MLNFVQKYGDMESAAFARKQLDKIEVLWDALKDISFLLVTFGKLLVISLLSYAGTTQFSLASFTRAIWGLSLRASVYSHLISSQGPSQRSSVRVQFGGSYNSLQGNSVVIITVCANLSS